MATAFCFGRNSNRVALGGRERATTLVDSETGKVVFKAKNLPPDPQTLLQQPIWPTSILFLGERETSLAVGTAYKELHIYDVRDDSTIRRPIASTPEGQFEYRVTCLCETNNHELVVGDTAGYLYSLDVRKLERDVRGQVRREVGRYSGPAGSIRSLMKHPSQNRMAAVGLDRMLRVYDTITRQQLFCVYLKQRLNKVLFSQEIERAQEMYDEDMDQEDLLEDYLDSDEDSALDDNNLDIKDGVSLTDGGQKDYPCRKRQKIEGLE